MRLAWASKGSPRLRRLCRGLGFFCGSLLCRHRACEPCSSRFSSSGGLPAQWIASHDAGTLTADQQGQPALAAAHRGQQCHRVTTLSELPENLSFLIAEHSGTQELLQRCSWRVVLPLDPAPLAHAAFELERWLEQVREQPQSRVQLGKELGHFQAHQMLVAHHPADQDPVLLLHPGLIVALVRA